MNLNRQAGMTLIELMIGIVLLAILLALGAPTFFRWTQNSQIRNAAEAVQNGLTLARAEAVRRNTTVRFQLVTTTTAACALSPTGANWVVSLDSPAGSGGTPRRLVMFRGNVRAAHHPGSCRRRRFPQRRRQWQWGIADHLQRHGPGKCRRNHRRHQSNGWHLRHGCRTDALHAREGRHRWPDSHVRSGARRH